MKKNLGNSIFIIVVFFLTTLSASTKEYVWSGSINKSSASINEAIYLKYECTFVDRSELYVIEFAPKSNDNYEIISLSQTEKIRNFKRINTYEYVVFAKKAGRLEFDFNVKMKKTNKDSIENTVLGRDNAQFEEFSVEVVQPKKLFVTILKSEQQLVGNFELEIKKDTPEIKAFEPYHLHIIIRGKGVFDALKPFSFEGVEAKVFSGDVEKNYKLTKECYEGQWSQKFAFVSDKNFTLPPLKNAYFDYLSGKTKQIKIDSIKVKVTKKYEPTELLDEIDEEKFSLKKEWFYYLLCFMTGFLVAKINLKPKASTILNTFVDKVNATKSLEELHMLLILQSSTKYKKTIEDIESSKIKSLTQAKKQIFNV